MGREISKEMRKHINKAVEDLRNRGVEVLRIGEIIHQQKEKREKRKKKNIINKILQGDLLELLPKFPNACVDFVLTDPPFNVDLDYGVYEDDMRADRYRDWAEEWMEQLFRVLKNGSYCVIFSGDEYLHQLLDALDETKFKFLHFLKWHKPNGQAQFYGTVLINKVELAIVAAKGNFSHKDLNKKGNIATDTVKVNRRNPDAEGTRDLGHPAARPVKLYAKIIRTFSDRGDIVLDPFLGSGTTAVAAKQNQRNWVGIDIDPDYVELARRRVKQVEDKKRAISDFVKGKEK